MKPLPQRKKSAEEIAALRDGFMPPAPAPAALEKAPPSSVLPPANAAPPEPRPPVEAKPVRSLRKSERLPSPAAHPPSAIHNPQSNLPAHRHSDREINEIRRSQAFEVQAPAAHLIALTAHFAIVLTGYFLVFAAAGMPFIDWLFAPVSFYVPAVLSVGGLGIAAWIFLKKKRSIHHAAFLAAIAFLVMIFGALYYFPHLRNAA